MRPAPLRKLPFFVVLPVAVGVAAAVVSIVAWQQVVLPWFEGRIAAATGHRTRVGALVPRWRGIQAREVVLYGTPPFEAAPLARIAQLDIAVGGDLLSPRATSVTATGALITYLALGAGGDGVDNFRGRKTVAPPAAAPAGPGPVLLIKDSRFEAFVRLAAGGSLSARCERVWAERDAAGRTSARGEALVVDLPGWATMKVPRVELTSERETRLISARDLVVTIPGGGALLAASTLDVRKAADRIDVAVSPAPPPSAGRSSDPVGRLEAKLLIDAGGVTGAVNLSDLPLAALQPVLRRLDVGVPSGTAQLRLRAGPGTGADKSDNPGPRAGAISVDAALEIRDLGLYHPRLDQSPWQGIAVQLTSRGELVSAEQKLVVQDAELTALGLGARLGGWIGWREALQGELRLLPPARGPLPCAELLATWPAPLRDRLRGLVLGDKVAAHGRVAFDARKWDDLELEFALRPLCTVKAEPKVVAQLLTTPTGKAPPPQALPGLAGAAAALPGFVPLRGLPRHLIAAFLTAEDGAFRHHNGFDLEMVRRAIAHNLAMGTPTKGASTISQQLAKNLFLSPQRTLARKLAELVLTWRLEQVLSKDRILELYLNVVELGPGIRGIGRAAEVYFGKPAAGLTPRESAHLAAMLPNPIGFARRFRDGRVDDGWLLKLYDLLARMHRGGALSEDALVAARASHLGLRKF